MEEDVRLLDAHLPGFSDLDDVSVPPRVSAIRAQAVDVLLATRGQDSVVDYIERASVHWSQLNVRPEDFPDPTLYRFLIMEGPEVAIEWALKEVFSRSVTAVPMWRLQYSRPFLAPVVDDPRIRKAIERWEEQEARIRGEVLEYLASR